MYNSEPQSAAAKTQPSHRLAFTWLAFMLSALPACLVPHTGQWFIELHSQTQTLTHSVNFLCMMS